MISLRWLGTIALVLAATSASAQSRDIAVEGMRSEKRLALVIGNAGYSSSPLKNPVNDARAIAQSLREVGFDVIARQDASQKDMRRAIIEFGDRLQAGGVGLFYYAGHGIQVGGRNYLVPIDAAIKSESEVEVESVDVASVLARMDTAKNRVNIVILDACRDNPFGRSFRSSARGLASIDAPAGTIIAYATAPGRVAADGAGANGIYTGELLKTIRVPGLKIEDVFKRVRLGVERETAGVQVPWESSSLTGDFFFSLSGAKAAAIEAPQADDAKRPARRPSRKDVASRPSTEERNDANARAGSALVTARWGETKTLTIGSAGGYISDFANLKTGKAGFGAYAGKYDVRFGDGVFRAHGGGMVDLGPNDSDSFDPNALVADKEIPAVRGHVYIVQTLDGDYYKLTVKVATPRTVTFTYALGAVKE